MAAVVLCTLLLATAAAAEKGSPETFFHRPRGAAPVDLTRGVRLVAPTDALGGGGSGVTVTLSRQVIDDRDPWGDVVNVTWTGATPASSRDAVALYCPWPGDSGDASDVLDAFPVTDCGTWRTGSCTSGGGVPVRLFDMRTACRVGFLRAPEGNGTAHVLVSLSEPVTYASQGMPTQLRTMVVDEKGGPVTRVAFTTAPVPLAREASVEVRPAAAAVSAAVHATRTFRTAVTTYAASDLCSAPANQTTQQLFRDPGLLHVADIVGLAPGRAYEYRAVTGVGATEWIPYSAPPPRDADTVGFAVIADHGTYGFPVYWQMPGANATLLRIADDVEQGKVGMVVHGGDLSYAVGNAYLWDQWGTNIAPLASRISWNVALGNHEYDGPPAHGWHPTWGDFGDDSHGECGIPTATRFPTMPSLDRPWRTLQWGPVLLVMMSTEHSWLPGSEQYEWMQHVLSTTDRSATPFVVIIGHRPMYSSQLGADPDHIVSLHFRDAMDSLINAHGVDLMLTGHYHSYERSCPVFHNACAPEGNATTHIVVGTAGAILEEGAFPGKWSRFHAVEYGYGRITATRDTLLWEFVGSERGEVIDSIKLAARKGRGGGDQ